MSLHWNSSTLSATLVILLPCCVFICSVWLYLFCLTWLCFPPVMLLSACRTRSTEGRGFAFTACAMFFRNRKHDILRCFQCLHIWTRQHSPLRLYSSLLCIYLFCGRYQKLRWISLIRLKHMPPLPLAGPILDQWGEGGALLRLIDKLIRVLLLHGST